MKLLGDYESLGWGGVKPCYPALMRVSIWTLPTVLTVPAVVNGSPPRVVHRTTRPRMSAAEPSASLPVPSPKPPVAEVDLGPNGRALHFGTVTLTPGGFLNVGTRGSSGRD